MFTGRSSRTSSSDGECDKTPPPAPSPLRGGGGGRGWPETKNERHASLASVLRPHAARVFLGDRQRLHRRRAGRAARHRLLRAADRRRRRCPQVRQSAGTEGTTLQVEGEERHLHLLLWRSQALREDFIQAA